MLMVSFLAVLESAESRIPNGNFFYFFSLAGEGEFHVFETEIPER